MIEVETSGDGVMEITMSGRVTRANYDNTLAPAIEAALAEHKVIRVLGHVTKDFEGYDLGAAWSDTKLGVNHWSGFDRVALVTDVGWMATGTRAMAFIAPCPVEVFPLSEMEAARRWLRESLGSIHMTDLGDGVLEVKLLGKLDPAAYDGVAERLDAHLSKNAEFSLLLDLRDFDGWHGLSGVFEHLNLVRGRGGLPRRIAVLGNTGWQRMGERVISRFVKAQAEWFEDPNRAKDWVGQT